ncbi:unnamed protein product [Pneumocystis jirovecii]|uniref:Uncharacterized protein n=1 Tax=Pneumocystis jirovecii TaxID=42068 RepID=L0PFD2_PNEJI|nr:unnamed protein product [Pneumocystis jirovecii]
MAVSSIIRIFYKTGKIRNWMVIEIKCKDFDFFEKTLFERNSWPKDTRKNKIIRLKEIEKWMII